VTGGSDAVQAYLDAHRESLLETTLDLLAVDTQNPPGETAALASLVEDRFEALGLSTERLTVDPAKPNVLATLPGERDATLLYNGHLDTVPYTESEWSRDPLGERDGDRLYGRGATDMKGQVAAMIATAAAFVETDTTPPLTMQFLLVSDEETGGAAGLEAVLDQCDLRADGCVIGETTCDSDRYAVTVADRGSIWLTLSATGRGAHGSRPVLGDNAIDRLYAAVDRIRAEFGSESLTLPPELAPIVDESVAYYEGTLDTETATALFETPTVNLGVIEGGDSINSVPTRATARLDIRVTAGVETSDLLARIRECVDGCEGISIDDVDWSVGTYEPIDSPLPAAVAETASAVTGERIYRRSATGGGDAKTFRNAGIPTVEFGIGTDTVHAVDEYTTGDAVGRNASVYARLPSAFATTLD
jgi:succinyl-diaminopimelate desuccinylase